MGIEFECIAIEKGDDTSVILGHAGFIKTVEDLYEAMVGSVPGVKFGMPTLFRFVGMGGLLNSRKEVANVSALLKRLDLQPLKGAAKAKIRIFSGGNQQKVIIARWLLGSADIFMFDEPTQGIDVGAREQVYEVIRELAEQGAGIIIVSSEAEELARLCSTVHVMRDGSIVQTLIGDDVTESKISHATVEGRVEMSNA